MSELVERNLVICGEVDSIRLEGQSQGCVANLSQLAIGQDVEGMIWWNFKRICGSSSTNGGPQLTQLPVILVLLLMRK